MTQGPADPPSRMGRVSRGGIITMGAQGLRVAVNVVSLVLLARILAPEAFGILAMAMVTAGLADLLRDFGLSSAAVQAPQLSRAQASNLFWLNLGLGAAATAAFAALAPVLAWTYRTPEVAAVVLALAPMFLINGASTQFRAHLNREERFLALNVIDVFPMLLGLGVALVSAWNGASYWSLVAQQLTVAGAGLLLAIWTARFRPGWPRRQVGTRPLVKFGGNLFAAQLIAQVTKGLDAFLLGARYNSHVAGIYDRAYRVMMMPLAQLQAPLTRVALPALSRAHQGLGNFAHYLRKTHALYLLSLGTLFGVSAALGPQIIAVVLGPAWREAAPVFQVLAIGGVFRCVLQIYYWAAVAAGRASRLLRLYAIVHPTVWLAMILGLPWGATGVAVGHTAGYAAYWLVSALASGWVVGDPLREMLSDFVRIALRFVLPVALAAWLSGSLVDSPFASLTLGLGAGVAVGMVLLLPDRPTREDVRVSVQFVRRGFSNN